MTIKYELAVIIARMQPMHLEHEALIKIGLEKAHYVLVLLGSANGPPSLRNPFSVYERKLMIADRFGDCQDRLIVKGLRDMIYRHDLWVEEVKETIKKISPYSILMISGAKDDTRYPKDFPKYDHYTHPVTVGLNATDLREQFFEQRFISGVSGPVQLLLKSMQSGKQTLREEYEATKTYKESWSGSPFPPMFVTADNLVNWNQHILLVQRKSEFGDGQWALPGGYVESHQTLEEAARAECFEEAGLTVGGHYPPPTMIDAPNRSERGRIITAVFHLYLHTKTAPVLKAGDDAVAAAWFSLDEISRSEYYMFSDHFHIIGKFYPEIYNV